MSKLVMKHVILMLVPLTMHLMSCGSCPTAKSRIPLESGTAPYNSDYRISPDVISENFNTEESGDFSINPDSVSSSFPFRPVPLNNKGKIDSSKSVVIRNLSQKFGAVADTQDSIANSIINRGPSLFGLKMDDLDVSDKQFIELLKKKQLIAIDHISLLQKDLEASLVNKRNHSHEEVLSAMKENKVISSFKYTHDSISKLHLVNSIQLAKSHSKMLREWSLKLETK